MGPLNWKHGVLATESPGACPVILKKKKKKLESLMGQINDDIAICSHKKTIFYSIDLEGFPTYIVR